MCHKLVEILVGKSIPRGVEMHKHSDDATLTCCAHDTRIQKPNAIPTQHLRQMYTGDAQDGVSEVRDKNEQDDFVVVGVFDIDKHQIGKPFPFFG